MKNSESKVDAATDKMIRQIIKEILLKIEEQMNTRKSVKNNLDNTYKKIIQRTHTRF